MRDNFDDVLENEEWFEPEKKKEISPYVDAQSKELLNKIKKLLKI